MSEEVTSVGFDAIADRMQVLYPQQQEFHYGTLLPYSLGGKDPLDGLGVWKSEKGMPHWHYVTYGFSELYEKESDDPDVSGYGFELTFRLRRGEEETPPAWPMNLLQNLARYVFSTGNVFGNGHHMSCNGPVALETGTLLTALGFCIDPELGEMDTPNGHVTFLQAVAITNDEMEAHMCWSGEKFLGLLFQKIPFGITDLERCSLMDQKEFYDAWKAGVDKDGSSTGFLYMDEVGASLKDGRGRLRLGAGHTHILATMLSARVGKGRKLYLQGPDMGIGFEPGEAGRFGLENDFAVAVLDNGALKELCSVLQPHAGVYSLGTIPLTVELVPTRIKDQNDKVLKVIE